MRVVSLLPGTTETIYALGVEGELVGRSHHCDYPEEAKQLPVITIKETVPHALNGIDINSSTEVLQHTLSTFYQVDVPKLVQLQPDIIFTQLRRNEAVDNWEDIQQLAYDTLGLVDTRVISLDPTSVQDVMADIRTIASTLDLPHHGDRLVDKLQRHIVMIAQRAKMIKHKPGVVMIGNIDPLMTIGNWLPSMIHMAGAETLFGVTGQDATYLEIGDIGVADPDILVISCQGCDLSLAKQQFTPFLNIPEIKELRAVKEEQVFVVNDWEHFSRPGPRIGQAIEILAEIFHPRSFGFGHEGEDWIRLSNQDDSTNLETSP